jgi:hypothetical protein
MMNYLRRFGGMQLKIQTDLQMEVYTSILKRKPNSILPSTIEVEYVFCKEI